MKYLIRMMVCLWILLSISNRTFSQHLVKSSSPLYKTGLTMWSYEVRGNYFAVIDKISELDASNIEYTILDQDIETGKFFWIENKTNEISELHLYTKAENIKVLWRNNTKALVRVNNINLFYDNYKSFEIKRVNFRTKQNYNLNSPLFLENKATKSGLINTIIDSVDINQIITTLEHLSGETSFLLNGQLDSIQTRYSYSPQIHKAKDYLQDRFENYGYTVDYLPFALGTFYDIQFFQSNPNYGWLTTEDKIFGTSDGGNTWSAQYEGTNGGSLWSVFAKNQNLAFAVGQFGYVLRTTDGQSWQLMSTPTSAFLFGVHFKSDTLGWICGDTGLILKTTNGGTTWSTKSTPTSQRLYDIFFINDSTGWAVGRNGTIIHTNNYGETWTTQSTPITNRLYGIHFIDENNGFAVGWGGVLRTTNGGTNWTTLSVPSGSYLYDIDFVNPNIGMIVGWNGTCLTTSNGGTSWSSAGNIFQNNIYGFDLISSTEAWSSGVSTVAQSTDFGGTWTDQLDSIPSGALINLIATKAGTTYPDQHYILCAHYDATSNNPMVSAPGADDNGSGTATVIEAARVLADYDYKYSIKFVLFPGEEQGLHGSAAYAANAFANGEQILGVLNMDMIAYDGNGDGLIEIHAGNLPSSQAIGTFIISNVSTFGLNLTTEYKTSNSSSASDHSSFWDYGYPAIMHIEDFQDFTPYYHTINDLISTLNIPYFHENAKLNIATLALLAEIDSSATSLFNQQISPEGFVLVEPYPNPFNPKINIKYQLNQSGKVEIDIYNIQGQKIRNIVNEFQAANNYTFSWNGTDSDNKKVASGIYFLSIQALDYKIQKKLLLIR